MAFGESNGKKTDSKKYRIAFTGEEYGFGYQAVGKFAEMPVISDAGRRAVDAAAEREFEFDEGEPGRTELGTISDLQLQPLRTKDQSLMAVKSKTADMAVVPFYHPYSGYDKETLRAMTTLGSLMGVEQVAATDTLCLAVYEPQVLDLVQSAHPGSGLSSLLKRTRDSWGSHNIRADNYGVEPADSADEYRAGLHIDQSQQLMLRDRIDIVFAGPEAARRCKAKLDGLRAAGVDVSETLQSVEPHREMARLARKSLDRGRTVNTFFDPRDGKTTYASSMSSEGQDNPLYGVILPFQVAMMSSDYTIVDPDVEDSEPTKTRFMLVREVPDHTLFEDKYRTTDARTRYWNRRLSAIAQSHERPWARIAKVSGALAMIVAIGLFVASVLGQSMSSLIGLAGVSSSAAWVQNLGALGSWTLGPAVISFVMALMAYALVSTQGNGRRGVRVMFKFRRDGSAASIGDVEDFLRNYGVRHQVVRVDEDSGRDSPASMVLDVEFDREDFSFGIGTMLTRRGQGSIVNGALKKAFQRWKNRGVTILAAMPFEERQLAKQKPRRWWVEGRKDWSQDFADTMFIRFSRVIFFYVLPAALAVGGLLALWSFTH